MDGSWDKTQEEGGASPRNQARGLHSPRGVPLTHTTRGHRARLPRDRRPGSRPSPRVHSGLRGPFATPSPAPQYPLQPYQVTPMTSDPEDGRTKEWNRRVLRPRTVSEGALRPVPVEGGAPEVT